MQQVSLLKLINPTDRQKAAFEAVARHDFTLYGGAAGGGKSYWLRWCLVWLLVEFYRAFGLRNVMVGMFCEDYPSLYDRQISKMQMEFPPWLGKLKLGDLKGFHLHEQFGGGLIALRNLNDPSKYLSAEFAAIALDEATKNQQKVFDFLRLRLRWPGVERPKFIGGTNWGGVGHSWTKSYWYDRDYPVELQPIANQFAFVPALATDNPHLSKNYWNQLRTLPTEMQRIYVEGNPNVFAGQYFDVFSPFDHVKPPQEFGIKGWSTRWIGIDWGFKHPASAHWFAQPQSDLTVTYREELKAGLTPTELAGRICELSEGEDISEIYLSPDAFRNTTGADTIAQQMNKVFRERGLPVAQEAEDNRPSGWAMMYDYLKAGRWFIGSNCANLIKTLPMLTRDEKRIEDCVKFNATDGKCDGDDSADSARYGLRSHFKETLAPVPVRIEERFEQIKRTEPGVSMTHLMMARARIEAQEKAKTPRPVPIRRRFNRWATKYQ